jgi:hypothetical protein
MTRASILSYGYNIGIHRLNLEPLNLERPNLERLNLEWTETRMNWTPNGLNPDWDSNPTGLNPDWDSTPTRYSTLTRDSTPPRDSTPTRDSTPGWDWTLNGTQPRHFPLNPFQYGVNRVSGGGVHQKNGLLKRDLLGVESQSGLSPGSPGTQPQLRLNPLTENWTQNLDSRDSTLTETQPPTENWIRMGTQPRHFPLNPSNMVYNNVSRSCT